MLASPPLLLVAPPCVLVVVPPLLALPPRIESLPAEAPPVLEVAPPSLPGGSPLEPDEHPATMRAAANWHARTEREEREFTIGPVSHGGARQALAGNAACAALERFHRDAPRPLRRGAIFPPGLTPGRDHALIVLARMRSFIVIGRTATASPDFSLEDLPSSSGRLDVLLRCVRAALLYSHGLRTDVRVYLVLRGSPLAPRVLRIDAATARFIRPDERSLAVLVKKTLGAAHEGADGEFVELRPGVSLARGDLDCVLSELGEARLYLLDEHAPDVREVGCGRQGDSGAAAYFLGDHLGFESEDRERLSALGATAVSVGPRSLHSDDVIAVLWNELDRSDAQTC